MENKSHAMAAGSFVVVVAALLIVMAVWLTRDSGTTCRLRSAGIAPSNEPSAA